MNTVQFVNMSRTLRKAVEVAKQKKETELNLPDEGVANLEDVPELCKIGCDYVLYIVLMKCSFAGVICSKY